MVTSSSPCSRISSILPCSSTGFVIFSYRTLIDQPELVEALWFEDEVVPELRSHVRRMFQ